MALLNARSDCALQASCKQSLNNGSGAQGVLEDTDGQRCEGSWRATREDYSRPRNAPAISRKRSEYGKRQRELLERSPLLSLLAVSDAKAQSGFFEPVGQRLDKTKQVPNELSSSKQSLVALFSEEESSIAQLPLTADYLNYCLQYIGSPNFRVDFVLVQELKDLQNCLKNGEVKYTQLCLVGHGAPTELKTDSDRGEYCFATAPEMLEVLRGSHLREVHIVCCNQKDKGTPTFCKSLISLIYENGLNIAIGYLDADLVLKKHCPRLVVEFLLPNLQSRCGHPLKEMPDFVYVESPTSKRVREPGTKNDGVCRVQTSSQHVKHIHKQSLT